MTDTPSADAREALIATGDAAATYLKRAMKAEAELAHIRSTSRAGEVNPFAFAGGVEWHKPAHRAVMASVKLGAWLSAALDDPQACDEMKADIREWFSAGEPMETLCQALAASDTEAMRLLRDAQIDLTIARNRLQSCTVAAIAAGMHREQYEWGEWTDEASCAVTRIDAALAKGGAA